MVKVVMKWLWLVLGLGAASEFGYQLYKRLRKRKPIKCVMLKQPAPPVCEVLFFPGRGDQLLSNSREGSANCSQQVEPPTVALERIVAFLRRARSSLDLAIFTFTSQQLADEVLSLHKNGVRVRYVGDQVQALEEDSQVERLRSAGVAVRCHSSNFLMHHKFAVVDNKQVLCGSLNWTRNGVWGNYENVLISTDPGLVSPFLTEFACLWEEFNPTKVTG